ncbi:SusC/RagA family TonB-linked outer membrane protein [Mucilaginibacter pedocola]|uniref:Secretin/TonB short N-terminal domain-containing protein n=1 Tax=Mucilaginibacter pedocola TaxID=1792845 RepID=A0A1S9P6Z6_9SPHI|nr:SusC/RagA family TonB-linked outer membrane protein [Mucilaginibacter pedocola]OOQ56726.1 hypothetical protein BC343_17175 [Mucilaginibacter pedocola]
MKLSTFILLIGLLQASAKGYSQVTLYEKHASLEKVLLKIEKQTNYIFIYDENKLNVPEIDVNVSNVSVEKALEACFKNLPVSYSIIGKNIILAPATPTLFDKVKQLFTVPIQIRGIVTDSTGIPLNRATVYFTKRRNQQVAIAPVVVPAGQAAVIATVGEISYVTNENGLFYMDVEEGDELAVSYIGYKTYHFKVKKDMPFLNIILYSETSQLKEVTVQTGYQNLSKERATGSFSKPDMKIFANRVGTMDVIARLDGQIPGLTIGQDQIFNTTTRQSTRRALVRGTSSIQLPTEPLYVVNGVIVTDFSSLNIDDIADITVLKDAAAAAIWGAQAANGVIVVATKSGVKNQRVKISYSGFVNFQGKPDFSYQRNLTSKQYIQAAKEVFDPVTNPYSSLYSSYIAPHDQILYDQYAGILSAGQANAKLDSLSAIDNTQQIKDLWYRNAITTNHTLSASAGNKYYSFFASLGYNNTRSNTIGETSNTYRINLDQNFTPNDRFSFSLSTQLANAVSGAKHPISVGSDFLPYQLFKNADGSNISMPYIYGMSSEQRAYYQSLSKIDLETYSPLDELNYGHSSTNGLSINTVANGTVKLWKGLSYHGTFGYLTSPATTLAYDDHAQYSMRKNLLSFTVAPDVNSVPVYYIPATGGNFRNNVTNQRNWTVRNQLVYNYSGRDGNDLITLQGGQEANERLTTGVTTNLMGYDEDLQTAPLLDYLKLSQGVFGTVTGAGFLYYQPYQVQEIRSRFKSYFGLAGYTLNHKYSVDASWRVDHSNLFGSDVSAQNKPVYSFGAKWNLAEEGFLKPLTWINGLAIRATYGITGNSPYVGSATVLDILSPEQYTQYPQIAGPSYYLGSAANKKLSWETTHTTNLGLDFAIFNSRLSGSIEYYHKNTTSLLGSLPLDIFTGQGSAISNIGNLTNDGINIGLNSVNIQSSNFRWSTGFVFGFNKNKLVDYGTPQSYMNQASYRLFANYVIGYPTRPLFAYRYAGLDNVGDPQIKLADGTITKDPTKPTADDLVYMGSTTPKFNGGISNSFRYKQFELTLNMIYSLGAVMRKDVNQFYVGRLTGNPQSFSGNIHADFANRWQKPGDELTTNIPAYTSRYFYNYAMRNTGYYTNADINVVSASYLKLREATLAYDLDPRLLKWLKVQSISLRAQVNNILLWTANKAGLDPELQNYTYGGRGTRVGQHTIALGANINF